MKLCPFIHGGLLRTARLPRQKNGPEYRARQAIRVVGVYPRLDKNRNRSQPEHAAGTITARPARAPWPSPATTVGHAHIGLVFGGTRTRLTDLSGDCPPLITGVNHELEIFGLHRGACHHHCGSGGCRASLSAELAILRQCHCRRARFAAGTYGYHYYGYYPGYVYAPGYAFVPWHNYVPRR
jgi:hypothetical protein